MTESVTRPRQPVKISWELKTGATREKTWEAFADTDRFNRVADLGFTFKEEPQKDGTTKRTGQMRRLGLTLTFDDLPFQYRTPEWFRKVRRFHNGPALELITTVRLRPGKDGTLINYTIEVVPRFFFTRPIVALELSFLTRPQLTRVLNKVLSFLSTGNADDYDPRPPALSQESERRLKQVMSQLRPVKLATALGEFLRTAPLPEQDRILPLRMAKRWDVPAPVALEGFLTAVNEGVLALRWDVICPSCGGAKQRVDSLEDVGRDVHCPSCNVRFDGAFPDSVEVSFRPSPSLRTLEINVACMGSPGRQPQIVAQDRLEPGGETELEAPLTAGAYRIRTWPPREACSVDAMNGIAGEDPTIVAGPYAFSPDRAIVAPGTRTLKVKNPTDRGMDVILERITRPADLMTVGKLLEIPSARAMLPNGAVPASFEVQTHRVGVLALEVVRGGEAAIARVEKQLRESKPRRLHRADNRLVATWPTFAATLTAARPLTASQDVRCALTVGPVLEALIGGETVPVGSTVDEVMGVLRGSFRGVLSVPARIEDEREVQNALTAQVGALAPPNYQATDSPPSLWVKF